MNPRSMPFRVLRVTLLSYTLCLQQDWALKISKTELLLNSFLVNTKTLVQSNFATGY